MPFDFSALLCWLSTESDSEPVYFCLTLLVICANARQSCFLSPESLLWIDWRLQSLRPSQVVPASLLAADWHPGSSLAQLEASRGGIIAET